MKKTIILILILISTNIILSQEKIEKKTYDDANEAFNDIVIKGKKSTTGFGSLGSAAASTYRGENTGLGNSKTDEDLSWNANVEEEDIKGSIKRYRNEKQKEVGKINARFIGIVITVILLIFLLFYILDRNHKDKKILIDIEKTPVIIKNQKTNKNNFVNSVIEKEESYLEKNEGKIEVQILESQITFLNEIITNRNGKAVCEKLKENLKGAKTKKMLPEESFEITNKKAVIKRVTKLMLKGVNEETALLKTKNDLMQELNKKTNETIEDLLEKFYNS